MRVLFPAAVTVHCGQLIVLGQVHWFMARKSRIFNEEDVNVALSTKNNNFSHPPPPPTTITTFPLFSNHHQHHHISVVFPPPPAPPLPPPHFLCFTSTTNRLVHLKIAHDLISTKKLPHFNHEIKTKRYDVIGVHEFLPSLMRLLSKKRPNWSISSEKSEWSLVLKTKITPLSAASRGGHRHQTK